MVIALRQEAVTPQRRELAVETALITAVLGVLVIVAANALAALERAVGTYGSHALGFALRVLDAGQVSTQLRRKDSGESD